MPSLDEVIGALLAAVVKARKAADEQTAIVAEHYRKEGLLYGLSVPRLRIPDITLDIPVAVTSHDPGEPPQFATAAAIARAAHKQVMTILRRERVRLPSGFVTRFSRQLHTAMERAREDADVSPSKYGEAADQALRTAIRAESSQIELSDRLLSEVRAEIRRAAASAAVRSPGRAPGIEVAVVTADVKELAGSQNVTRLHLVLREEGLEWSVYEDEQGQTVEKLTPE